MRVEKIEDGKATITIGGNEMVEMLNALNGNLYRDLQVIYSIACYHKVIIPKPVDKEGAEE